MTDHSRYLDAAQLRKEYGFSRDQAYRIMRKVGYVDLTPAGIGKRYVLREHLDRFLEQHHPVEPF